MEGLAMMDKHEREPQPTSRLEVSANLQGFDPQLDKLPSARVYVFSGQGKLLAMQDLDEKLTAALDLPGTRESRQLRVLVGPRVESFEDDDKIDRLPALTPDALLRRGAEEMLHLPNADLPRLTIPVFPDKWKCWFLSLCVVRGELLKAVSGQKYPIPNARVEIYEVDPIFIILPKLPRLVVDRIREFIVKPFPIPGPGPVEIYGERILPQARLLQRRVQMDMDAAAMDALASGDESIAAPADLSLTEVGEEMPAEQLQLSEAELRSTLLSLPTELRLAAQTGTDFQFRSALLLHPNIAHLLLCHVWPMAVSMQLIATAKTDSCGRFKALFFRGCNNPDQPDLYFKAKQRILPFPFPMTTIYAPTPISCYTHWNYKCGTEVTLVSTHPLAIASSTCPESVPERGVVIKAIGNRLLTDIYGTSTNPPGPVTADNRGLTFDSTIPSGRPWGGTLRMRFDFDPALRDVDVRYYQVSYRRIPSDGSTPGSFIPLQETIRRFYTVWLPTPSEVYYELGPQTVGTTNNLYEIPKEGGPFAGATWTIRDLYEDTIHAKFVTTSPVIAPGAATPLPGQPLPVDRSGKFQLKVDLYDVGGNPVNLAAKGVTFYVPTPIPAGGSSADPEPAASLGLVVGNSFIMTVHVDNNTCAVSMNAPSLDGSTAGDECGILNYTKTAAGAPTGNLMLSYAAGHRNSFASYHFNVQRGAFALPRPGVVLAGIPANGQAVDFGGRAITYSATNPTFNMLAQAGGVAFCPVAGFVAQVHVEAWATDGLSILTGYDARDQFAFAVAPEGL
jgi:hypothetical protein